MSPMSSSVVSLIFFYFFLLLSVTNTVAFNITEILKTYPDLTIFNSYLTQTGVAGEINSKQTVTVLCVGNDNMSSIAGQPTDVIKKILSVHVVLDYYDLDKFEDLTSTVTLTTLYQESGLAQNQQGFLNVTRKGRGPVAIWSASPGSTVDSTLTKILDTQPYNISVVQISNLISLSSNSTSPSPPASNSTAPSSPVSNSTAPSSPVSNSTAPSSPVSNSTAPSSSVSNSTAPSSPVSNSTAPSSPVSNSTTPSSPPAPSPTVSSNTPPNDPPAASPPRKMLAPSPSKGASPVISPSNAPVADAANAPANAASSDNAGGSGVSATSRNYNDHASAILVMFITSAACFLLP